MRTVISPLPIFLAASVVLVLWLGPAHITSTVARINSGGGRRLPADQRFISSRNYIRYGLPPDSKSLSRAAVERLLVAAYGVGADAIFNANDQRGRQELEPDADRHVRIPLVPGAKN